MLRLEQISSGAPICASTPHTSGSMASFLSHFCHAQPSPPTLGLVQQRRDAWGAERCRSNVQHSEHSSLVRQNCYSRRRTIEGKAQRVRRTAMSLKLGMLAGGLLV